MWKAGLVELPDEPFGFLKGCRLGQFGQLLCCGLHTQNKIRRDTALRKGGTHCFGSAQLNPFDDRGCGHQQSRSRPRCCLLFAAVKDPLFESNRQSAREKHGHQPVVAIAHFRKHFQVSRTLTCVEDISLGWLPSRARPLPSLFLLSSGTLGTALLSTTAITTTIYIRSLGKAWGK